MLFTTYNSAYSHVWFSTRKEPLKKDSTEFDSFLVTLTLCQAVSVPAHATKCRSCWACSQETWIQTQRCRESPQAAQCQVFGVSARHPTKASLRNRKWPCSRNWPARTKVLFVRVNLNQMRESNIQQCIPFTARTHKCHREFLWSTLRSPWNCKASNEWMGVYRNLHRKINPKASAHTITPQLVSSAWTDWREVNSIGCLTSTSNSKASSRIKGKKATCFKLSDLF